MRTRPIRSGLFVLIALATVAALGAAAAQPGGGGGGQPGERRRPDGQSGRGGQLGQTVEQCMRGINSAARTLKDQVGDASKKDDNLKLIWTMERNAVQAKSLEPEHLPPGDKAKAIGDFRRAQIELLHDLLKLETETMDGKADEAKKTFASIIELRDKSHKKFGVKE